MGNNILSDKDVQDYDGLDEDLTLLIPTLELVVAQINQNAGILEDLLADLQYKHNLEERKQKQTPETSREKRKTFSEITSKLSERQFRCMFQFYQGHLSTNYVRKSKIVLVTRYLSLKGKYDIPKRPTKQLISVMEKFLENYE